MSTSPDKLKIENIFQTEKEFERKGYELIIGIDEAGRGPLAGPVVAAAVALRTLDASALEKTFGHSMSKYIRDSKKLSEKRREELYDFICENFHVGVGICDCATIDRVNILEATYLAMKKAVTSLEREISNSPNSPNKILNTQFQNSIILVDGNKEIPNLSIEQRAIVGGDNFVKSISAASIIAKVTRDRMMREAHTKFPQYNFTKHKGYGTAEHMTAIRKFGPCEIHRKSFRPVREALEMYRMMISNV